MTQARSQFFITAGAIFVVIAGLKLAEPFMVPVMLGLMIAAVSSPLLTWMTRHKLPPALGAALVLLLDMALLGLFGWLMVMAAGDLRGKLGFYAERLSGHSRALNDALAHQGLPVDVGSLFSASDHMAAAVGTAASRFAGVASMMAVMMLVIYFTLCELTSMGDKVRTLSANPDAQFERVDMIVRDVQRYLVVKLLTSLLAAVGAYILLRVVGVHLALLLALSMFLLHFIPNLGAVVATVPAVVAALLDRGFGAALVVLLGYLVVITVVGNIIEPRLLGTTLGLSPLFVLLAMLFWGWVWGPIGALLSVPIMVVGKIIVENISDLAWIARFAEPARSPDSLPHSAAPTSMMRPPSFPIGLGSEEPASARSRGTRLSALKS
ncbi:MAG: AI-2E family transporter [Myxococcales bacterium]|nr:MAG: AI-2E family transporter [Myxococcales bacterium]